MRFLITGGAGFIGSHMSERLLARGDEVHIIDDLSTGSIENIQHLKSNPRFFYHLDTVTNQRLTAELVDLCDIVVHLAAAVGVQLIAEDPVHIHDLNATILHQLGIRHDQLAFKFKGLNQRLTGVEPARVVREVLS